MSSSMNWVASNIAFFDLALQKTLPSQNASFQWGAMVLLMGFFPLVTSSLKSLKHSSDWCYNCLKIKTLTITFWSSIHSFHEKILLGFFIKEKRSSGVVHTNVGQKLVKSDNSKLLTAQLLNPFWQENNSKLRTQFLRRNSTLYSTWNENSAHQNLLTNTMHKSANIN